MPIPLCLFLSVPLLVADPGPPPPDTLFELGRLHGVQDAQEAPTRGDFMRGFGWGLVAGPLGAVVAVRRSSSAALPFSDERRRRFLELGAEYRDGYQEGFEVFYPPRRREATLVGSMVGSLAFGFILLQVADLPSRSRVLGQIPDEDPGFILLSVPVGSQAGRR